jgi:glycosyltransferase involved in cell wall biosynthesis/ADP-heptose:LPS heptosyltransferase
VYLASPKGGIFTSLRDYFFFRFCGISKVVGVPFSRSTLRSLPVPGTNLYTSRTSRAMEALGELGQLDVKDPRAWDLRLTHEESAEAQSLLAKHGISSPFLAVSAGTKMPSKDWEEHRWMELMQRLAAEYPGLPLVLLGVTEEWERSERLMGIWSGPKANLCGKTSPRVSAAVLVNAVAMVCHDSGPMHLAATMGVPCVAIFSARAKPGEWFPRGENHVVLYHKTPCWDCGLEECIEKKKLCILSITVDEVFVPVLQQLARRGIFARSESAKRAGAEGMHSGLPSGVRLWPARRASGIRTAAGSPGDGASRLRLLLVGNYEPDGQQSMQRFVAVLARELAAVGIEVSVVRPEPFFGRLRPGAHGLGKWLGYLDKFLVFPRRLRRLVRESREEKGGGLIVHICDHSNALYTRALREVPHLVTCHDMLAVRSALGEIPQNPTRWSGRILQRLVLHGLNGARAIACDSDATLRDLSRLARDAQGRSSVAKIGLNAPFHPVPKAEARASVLGQLRAKGMILPGDMRYILHVGDDSWYKNRRGVVELFAELRRASDQSDLWLVMVGKPLGAELRALIEDCGIADRVVEWGGLQHEELCAAYSAAELLLFPSLQEGFGWPVIEAQACGCAVVTTDRPPMNDVGGAAAACLQPEDFRGALDVLLNVLYENDRQRQARIDRGFANVANYTTAGMIGNYLALYANLQEQPR